MRNHENEKKLEETGETLFNPTTLFSQITRSYFRVPFTYIREGLEQVDRRLRCGLDAERCPRLFALKSDWMGIVPLTHGFEGKYEIAREQPRDYEHLRGKGTMTPTHGLSSTSRIRAVISPRQRSDNRETLFPLNEAHQHNRRTSVQPKPSSEALYCVKSTPLTASSSQNMWDLLAGNRAQELPLSVCHEIVPLPFGLSSRDHDLIKFLCKIIIQIAFNVPPSFGLKKKN